MNANTRKYYSGMFKVILPAFKENEALLRKNAVKKITALYFANLALSRTRKSEL